MFEEKMHSKEILKTDLASFLLFRQVLEIGDSLVVLIQSGCINASKPLIRSLLECYFQLAYVFKNNEDRKALQFLYHYETRLKDYYEKLAYPKKEAYLLKIKRLTEQQVANRQLLRSVMRASGYMPIDYEWWHFNAVSRATAKAIYRIIQ